MPRQKSKHVDSATGVGLRLKATRIKRGISQRDLAFDGCSATYISRIEQGYRIPSLQLIVELAQRLDVTVEYLTHGSEVPRPFEISLPPGDVDGAMREATAAQQGEWVRAEDDEDDNLDEEPEVLGLDDLSEPEYETLLDELHTTLLATCETVAKQIAVDRYKRRTGSAKMAAALAEAVADARPVAA